MKRGDSRARGKPIANRYDLRERIGEGAMAEVWSAVDRKTGAPVAIKLAHDATRSEPTLAARFEAEAEILRRIRTPYVCALLDAGRTRDGEAFLVLERLSGESLEDLLSREGYLPLDEVGLIARHVLEALVAAHDAGVVHRDLCPANVYLHETRHGARVAKVLDFGIAKVEGTPSGGRRTGKGTTMGTLPYIAPEQLGDSASAGPRADLYALGAIVFRALTGRYPFGDARGTALVALKREHDPPSIDEVTGERWPTALRSFLAKTMARSPAKRYASARVALEALAAAVHGKGPRLSIPDRPRDATTTARVASPRLPRS
jgi:serine/threonine-protein kinase